MFDDHEKTFKKDVIERLGKAKAAYGSRFLKYNILSRHRMSSKRQENLLVLRIHFSTICR